MILLDMNFTLSIEISEKGEKISMKDLLITTGECSVDNIPQTPQLRYEKFVMYDTIEYGIKINIF
jgi:hypothetical protein